MTDKKNMDLLATDKLSKFNLENLEFAFRGDMRSVEVNFQYKLFRNFGAEEKLKYGTGYYFTQYVPLEIVIKDSK